MHPAMPATDQHTPPSRPLLGYFVAGSLLLHALLAGLWQDEAPAGPSAHSTFQITLVARHGDTASTHHRAGQTVPAEAPGSLTGSVESAPAAAAPARQASRRHPATGPSGSTKETPISSSYRRMPVSGTLQPKDDSLRAPFEPPAAFNAQALLSGVRRNDGKRIHLHSPATKRDPVKEASPQLQRKQTSARSGSTSHGQHELTSTARYRKTRHALLEALLPHFDYPPLARRRGWQGRVNVGLHVAADGDLTRIRLVKSSGHALLDRAAVRNVAELRGIPRAAQWLEGNGMDLVLPVRYQLAD